MPIPHKNIVWVNTDLTRVCKFFISHNDIVNADYNYVSILSTKQE